jgi:hypothetical protein
MAADKSGLCMAKLNPVAGEIAIANSVEAAGSFAKK